MLFPYAVNESTLTSPPFFVLVVFVLRFGKKHAFQEQYINLK